MFAFPAALFFSMALILHLAGGHGATYVLDFELGGLICVALHLASGGWPWGRHP